MANCVVLPDHVRTEDAALIEPLSCAVRGYDVLRSQFASSVLIYGSGTWGDAQAGEASRCGVGGHRGPESDRLQTARQLGVTAAAAAGTRSSWDVVIDATGNAKAIQDGLGRVGSGMFLQFGTSDYAARATIEPYKIYNQEITITGSMAVLYSYERATALFAGGSIDPAVFISDRAAIG